MIQPSPLPSEKVGLRDSVVEIKAAGKIAPLLQLWNEPTDPAVSVCDAFDRFDSSAIHFQRIHRWFVIVAALSGGIAVLMAILQLALYATPPDSDKWREALSAALTLAGLGLVLWVAFVHHVRQLRVVFSLIIFGGMVVLFYAWASSSHLVGLEIAAASSAAVAVVLGIKAAFNHNWRLARFKAERIRNLKFDMLLRSVHGVLESPSASGDHIRLNFNEFNKATYDDAHSLMTKRLQAVEPVTQCLELDKNTVDDLVNYVDSNYSTPQREYFKREGEKRRKWEDWTRDVSTYCFFVSVLCALLHFGVGLGERLAEHFSTSGAAHNAEAALNSNRSLAPSSWDVTLLLLAASFPVGATIVRTIRSAREYGRNANRFDAVASQLLSIQGSLSKPGIPDVDRLMWLERAVWLLETEQLAWMRLMHEAEWFG